jgi:GUN4-like
LAAGQWEEADRETENKIFELTGSKGKGWSDTFSVENFSCPDLRAMDRLWVKYSNGRFGFSVQKQIYQSLGGTKEYNQKVWEKYGEAIGWKDRGEKGEWLFYYQYWRYKELRAHLPALGGVPYEYLREGRAVFFSRVETCKL